jgi:aryl-alcohol dehydrogenase-like predicted oxidoreductase
LIQCFDDDHDKAAEQVYGYGNSEEFLAETMKAGLSDAQPITGTSFHATRELTSADAARIAFPASTREQVYGYGKSEEFLGEFMKAGLSDAQPIIATKFAPLPWRLTSGSVPVACKESLGRLQMQQMGLYIQHW